MILLYILVIINLLLHALNYLLIYKLINKTKDNMFDLENILFNNFLEDEYDEEE